MNNNGLPKIASVIAIAYQAAEALMARRGQVQLIIKSDGSPVTEADMESHRIISKALRKLTPGILIVSEENDAEINDSILKKHDSYWVVDPLDVTTNYVAGGDKFSVNIALIDDGEPILGLIYFPAIQTLYYTGDDGQAYRQIGDDHPQHIYIASGFNPSRGATPAQLIVHKSSVQISTQGGFSSLRDIVSYGQHRACLVAEGAATFCSEQAGFRIWDTAATHAIIRAAGGDVQAHDGKPLRYKGNVELPAYFVGHKAVLKAMVEENKRTGSAA